IPMPAAPVARPAGGKVGEPRPSRRQTSPVLVGFIGLIVAGSIAGGMYYAFGHKWESEPPPVARVPDVAKTEPNPGPTPIKPPAPQVEEPVVAEVPLPKDFADQLRPRTFTGHAGAVNAIAVAKSGSRFATAGTDRTLRLWSVSKDAAVVRHTFGVPALGVAWTDQDRRLLAADGQTVGLFDPLKSNPPRAFESPRGGVTALAVSPDGTKALTGLSDGYVRLWDVASGRPDEWPAAARGSVTAVDFSPDGIHALAAVQDGPVSLWELNGRKRVMEWNPHPGGAIAVQFSPNGKLAATTG